MKPQMNIFKQYFYAITNPRKYGELTKFGAGRIFLYLLLLSIFTSICTFTPPIISYFQVGGIEKVLDAYIPDFSFKSGKLKTDIKVDKSFDFDSIEEEMEDLDTSSLDFIYDSEFIDNFRNITLYSFLESFSQIDLDSSYSQSELQEINDELADKLQNESFYLYVDTSAPSVTDLIYNEEIKLDDIKEDNIAIITNSDFALLDRAARKKAIKTTSITTYPYEDSIDINITKSDITDTIKDILPIIYIIVAIIFFISIFVVILGWLISSLVFAILALIANAATHKHFKFGTLFKVCVYAHTTSIILCAILSLIPNEPAVISSIIRWIIPIIYIVLAILNMDDTPVIPQTAWNMYTPPYNGQNDNFNNPVNTNNQTGTNTTDSTFNSNYIENTSGNESTNGNDEHENL